MDNVFRFGSGREVQRLEDDALLQGQGQFTDDFAPEGAARAYFLRSPYPHANIRRIDTQTARSMPGVIAIFTGEDLQKADVKPLPTGGAFKLLTGQPAASPPRPAMAFPTVRFVGEAIAVIVAETLNQAKDAAEAIEIDFESLGPVVTLDQTGPEQLCAQTRYGNAAATDAAFAQAAHTIELKLENQRLSAVSIEPRTVLAHVDAEGRLQIRLSTQMPTGIKNSLAAALNIEAQTIRVVVGDVGGGFGMKTGIYPEDICIAFCAQRINRPIRWTAERSEEFLTAHPGRDQRANASLALDANGKILGLRVYTQANVGAYGAPTGLAINLLIGPWVTTSIYDIQTIDFAFDAYLTNTAPTGAYRGAGRPEAIYIIERLLDEAARKTGIDRVSLRRINMIAPEQMPYKNPMGQIYDTGAFQKMLDQALTLADYEGFEQRRQLSAQQGRLRGQGLVTFLEWTGGNALEETVSVKILSSGLIEIFSAVNQMGQGIATTLAQIVVDVFEVPVEQVRVVLGDTDRGAGFGSAGSRSIFTAGSALQVGSKTALARAKTLAAADFEASEDDIEYQQGEFRIKGTDISKNLFELVGEQPGGEISLQSSTTASGPSWPNACHICEVEVDPQTGVVDVVAYYGVNDIGRVVNPMIVRGQLEGGALQGIGQALNEAVVYDSQTGQLLTGSLMDYTAPRADNVQCMMIHELDQSVPSKNNVLGVKGVGELGTIGATPCVVNAVADALYRANQGPYQSLTQQLQMPLTADRLWSLMHNAT